MTTILDLADMAVANTDGDIKPLTPVWRAVMAAFYGLPLTEPQIDILTRVTSSRGRPSERGPEIPELPILRQRSRSYWEARKDGGKPFDTLVARVGRRGRKSWTIGLMSNFEAIVNDAHTMAPKGQTLAIPILATQISTTTGLTDPIKLYAKALGLAPEDVKLKGNRDGIRVDGIPYTFVVLPCKRAALIGWSCPFIAIDEFAHLNDEDSVESDVEIIRAIGPTQLQFRDKAKMFLISSPMGNNGEFHSWCEANLGDDPGQVIAEYRNEDRILAVSGPSWEFGADDEEDAKAVYAWSKAKEPDIEAFWREYGGVPSGSAGVAFDAAIVKPAFERKEGIWSWGRRFMVIDSSGGGTASQNTFACIIGRCGEPSDERMPKKYFTPDGTPVTLRDAEGDLIYEARAEKAVVRIESVFGWTGDEVAKLTMDVVIRQIARYARESEVSYVFGDQFGAPFIAALLVPWGIRYRHFAISGGSKHEAVLTIRWMLRESRLHLPQHAGLLKDLSSYPERIVGNRFVYERDKKKGHHHDFAATIITLAHALNGLAAGGGAIGFDAAGEDYQIQFAPTRLGATTSELIMPNNNISPEQQMVAAQVSPEVMRMLVEQAKRQHLARRR